MAESHPPRVAEPEERRAVGMLEVAFVLRDLHRTVGVKWVFAAVGGDRYPARAAMQPGVAGCGTLGAEGVRAGERRGVADLPGLAAGPEGRHAANGARGIGEERVERYLVERIGIRAAGGEGELDGHIGRGRRRGGTRGRPGSGRGAGFHGEGGMLGRTVLAASKFLGLDLVMDGWRIYDCTGSHLYLEAEEQALLDI